MLKKMAKRPQIGGNIPFSPVCIYIQYSENFASEKIEIIWESTTKKLPPEKTQSVQKTEADAVNPNYDTAHKTGS